MTDDNSIEESNNPAEAVQTPTIPKLTVIDVGTGISVCDISYDEAKYDPLVEEFRR